MVNTLLSKPNQQLLFSFLGCFFLYIVAVISTTLFFSSVAIIITSIFISRNNIWHIILWSGIFAFIWVNVLLLPNWISGIKLLIKTFRILLFSKRKQIF